jgi:hypothetical protein
LLGCFIIQINNTGIWSIWKKNGVKKIKKMDNKEMVNHPSHYGGADNKYEVIKIIEALNLDFHTGNAIKYLIRAGKKTPENEIEDLSKAVWYIDRKIKNLSIIKI